MKDDKAAQSRRDFLKLAATGAPAVAVASVAVGGKAAAGELEETGDRLRKTEHVKKYLETARF